MQIMGKQGHCTNLTVAVKLLKSIAQRQDLNTLHLLWNFNYLHYLCIAQSVFRR